MEYTAKNKIKKQYITERERETERDRERERETERDRERQRDPIITRLIASINGEVFEAATLRVSSFS